MEQVKNKNGIVVLLVVIIIILLALVILLATGTVSFKSNESNNDTIDNNQVTDTTNDTINNENQQNWVGQYKGTDPWGSNMTIKVNSISKDEIDLIVSNDYYEEEISTELINDTVAFHIQGTSEDNRYEVNYSVALTLKDNSINIKFVSGYLTSISPNGNASFNNVGPLKESEKTVVLKKEA